MTGCSFYHSCIVNKLLTDSLEQLLTLYMYIGGVKLMLRFCISVKRHQDVTSEAHTASSCRSK